MFKAQEKFKAIVDFYFNNRTITDICSDIGISRESWYKWEHQFRSAIGNIWGGLRRPHPPPGPTAGSHPPGSRRGHRRSGARRAGRSPGREEA